MNQSILFNDDFHYSQSYRKWCFTGLMSGEPILIVINSSLTEHDTFTIDLKLDYELLVEDWLENNEPENGKIFLNR